MAQVELNQRKYLLKALTQVPSPAVGPTYVSDIIALNIQNELSKKSPSLFENPKFESFFFYHCQAFQHKYFEIPLKRIFDYGPPFELKDAIITGSWSEGLFLYEPGKIARSDMDFMCILKNISFSEKDQVNGSLEVNEETPFVNAYITKPELFALWKNFVDEPTVDNEKHRLSARKLKAKLYANYKNTDKFFPPLVNEAECKNMGDGPSLEVRKRSQHTAKVSFFNVPSLCRLVLSAFTDSSDIVLATACEGWPICSSEWVDRRRFWPEEDLVRKISRGGFHIVPKSSPEGDFRLSFSRAEVSLIENLSPLQHKVLRAFKAIIKYHQNDWSPTIKDIICTYHLKTVAFWYFEKFPQDAWAEGNVVNHLLSLLEEFANVLRHRKLPMYFLPKCNLLKDVGTRSEMTWISDKVLELSTNLVTITETISKLERMNFISLAFAGPIESLIATVNDKLHQDHDDEEEYANPLQAMIKPMLDKVFHNSGLLGPVIEAMLLNTEMDESEFALVDE